MVYHEIYFLVFSIIGAFSLDLLLGDPEWLPHPIRGIGWCILRLEDKLVTCFGRNRLSGLLLTVIIVGGSYWGSAWLVQKLTHINILLGWMAHTVILYTTFAVHDLAKHSRQVFNALKNEEIEKARRQLAKIVGRDTESLDEIAVIRATVESVAENSVDGVLSPLFYALIGGAPLAMAFKAVSTLDSMVGYRKPRYLQFGWASARLDDFLNFIPARIALVFFPLAAFFCGLSTRDSFRIALRDGGKHTSPNAGISEALAAGALGVQLGGLSFYGGISYPKPILGDPKRVLVSEDILRTNRLMFITAILFLSCGVLVRIML